MKPVVLKNLFNEIVPLLAVIFQKSLNTGQVPKDWTKACVTPIFKKGDKSDPINYRPISLTCILCKVMEHVVAFSLSKLRENYKVLYDLQHGFREEKRSCETQLVQLVEKLARNTFQDRQTDLILLDFLIRQELITRSSCTSCINMVSGGALCKWSKYFWFGALKQ